MGNTGFAIVISKYHARVHIHYKSLVNSWRPPKFRKSGIQPGIRGAPLRVGWTWGDESDILPSAAGLE